MHLPNTLVRDVDAPADLVTPRWVDGGSHGSVAQTYAAWEECFAADAEAGLHQEPRLVLSPWAVRGGVPWVYGRWEDKKLCALGVLPERIHEVRLPGVPHRFKLRGRRLLDNRLLGDNNEGSLRALIEAAGQMLEKGETECVLFTDLEVQSPLRKVLLQVKNDPRMAVFYPSEPLPHWWIRFPEKPEDYWKQFSKKTRYNFRYRAKHLEHTVVRVTQRHEVAPFLEKVNELCKRTWQHQRLGMNIAASNDERCFWEHVASMGAFRSYLLEQNGKAIAYAMGHQWRGQYSYDWTGYDPEFAAKSPGQVLLYRIVEDLIAKDTPKLLDFGFGHSEYKEIYANHQTLSGPVALVRRAWRPMAIMRMDQARRAVGRKARGVLKRVGVLSAIRKVYRKG